MKKQFIVLALRNLSRYRTRNFLTGISIALGTTSIIIGLSFSNGIIRQTITGFTGTLVEDVMVFSTATPIPDRNNPKDSPTQPQKKSLIFRDVLFRNPTVLNQYRRIEKYIEKIPGIHYITKKVQFTAALFSDESSLNAMTVGMEPEGIRRKSNLKMESGRYLSDKDRLSLILSEKLARRLKVQVGDKLAIVVNMPEGGTNAKDFRVEGIFNIITGLEFVNHLIYISLRDAQELMGLDNEQVFSLGVYLDDVDAVDTFEKTIRKELHRHNLPGKVHSWKTVMQGILSQYLFIKYIVLVFTIILLIIVCVGVVNSVFLSISERTREIGTIMALGARRKTLIYLLLLEGALLSLISTVCGCMIGVSVSFLFENIGIAAPTKGAATLFGGKYLYAYLSYSPVLFAFVFVFVLTLSGVLFPILKASKMPPTKALGYF